MSDFMARFYESLERYVWESPDDCQVMREAHPGWEVDPKRLAIYGEFIPYYLEDTLEALFEGARGFLSPEDWRVLCRRFYRRRTSNHYEINHLAYDFPDWLREQPEGSALAADVALFELTRHQVFSGVDELPDSVEELSLNPTLATLELGHTVTTWAIARSEGAADPAPPAPEPELVLLWRNPQTLHANYWTARPRTLLALKIVLEGIPLEVAASEGGVPAEEIQAVIDEAVAHGLLLRP